MMSSSFISLWRKLRWLVWIRHSNFEWLKLGNMTHAVKARWAHIHWDLNCRDSILKQYSWGKELSWIWKIDEIAVLFEIKIDTACWKSVVLEFPCTFKSSVHGKHTECCAMASWYYIVTAEHSHWWFLRSDTISVDIQGTIQAIEKSSHNSILKYVLLDKCSILLLPNISLLCNLSYCLQPACHQHVSTYSQQFSQWGSEPLDFFRTSCNSVILSPGFRGEGSSNTIRISRKSSVAHSSLPYLLVSIQISLCTFTDSTDKIF